MSPQDIVTWLKERTNLNVLSDDVLNAIAIQLEDKTIPIYQDLAVENIVSDGIYILRSGCLETNSKQFRALGLIPSSVINIKSVLLNQPSSETITSLSQCEVWFLSSQKLQELVKQYSEIPQLFSIQLAKELEEISQKLSFEQERQNLLRSYVVPRAKRGIVGKSRYAERLRSDIKQASRSHQSVLIFGEPGLEKDNMAALIHYGSSFRQQPIIKVNCSTLKTNGIELFGQEGGKIGLLEALGEGTLILNNIQELPQELILSLVELLKNNIYTPVSRFNQSSLEKTSLARIIMISEKTLPEIDSLVKHLIKVPPLRVRKADLEDQVKYYINILCQRKGVKRPKVTPEAIRKLQAYDFPNNLRELESLVERSLIQLGDNKIITEEIIWPSQNKKKQYRINLLNTYPRLRQFLRSPWWTDYINYRFTSFVFAIVVILLFIGPQTRDQNFALNLFWAWWWPLILIGFPFLGRVWCSVCPFMIYGEITQKLSLILFPRQLKKWPRQSAEKWGGWFLYGLFALILLWEELWNLENTAYLSSCLLLLITAGAMIFSTIFERRFWCRYLCPIGGMNGMFAKLSMTELRAQQGTCSAECTTYQCYKGGPQKGEGMETDGCPLYSHPAQLENNRDCVLCMTCLKACPHRSVEFNLRFPGIELWTTHVARSYEVALLFLLLGAVFLHHLPKILFQLQLKLDLEIFWIHAIISVFILLIPILLPWFSQRIIKLFAQTKKTCKSLSFLELAYGYLPLVLMANLAHYLKLWLGEAGKILPVTFATFGLHGENLPVLVAHPAVISFLQGSVLILGAITSIILTHKIAKQSFKLLIPQHLTIIIITLMIWQVVVGY
ncbi:AAA family ATPase [Aphanothece hegewaldii CCALA 016]|uniref:AAA family ATPase n=1 Tax=Aphanothece hegewaldii CCALA 016 TaxID=2107694 RepID=A0A2T1LSC9_9CHRO|nr:sigma 54-interacting transcriptional regulator [Aphanothece hegewaldii]PSF32242.1 AAA family ATPase [Aphanothece hegewaldii CCALA 016]